MCWEDINNQILEINEQIQIVSRRQSEILPLAKTIKARQQKLGEYEDIRKQNNAILENKMQVTPIQTLLLLKLNELSLSDDMNQIYQSIPCSKEECNQFLMQLLKEYHLGEKIINMVEEIEKLSEIEYSNDSSFEETEYAKLIMFKDKMFEEIVINEILNPLRLLDKKLLELSITSKINIVKEYIDNLSPEKKKELFLQSVQLSYNKNAFHFFQIQNTVQNICNGIVIKLWLVDLYNLFNELFKNALLKQYSNESVEELLSNLNMNFSDILTQGQKVKK